MFLLLWCWRNWFDDGFVFSLVCWVETELTLDVALPKSGFVFLSGGTLLWGYSIRLENRVLNFTFRTQLLESDGLVHEKDLLSPCRFCVAISADHLKLLVHICLFQSSVMMSSSFLS